MLESTLAEIVVLLVATLVTFPSDVKFPAC